MTFAGNQNAASEEYLDYLHRCKIEAQTPLEYRQWLDRMERFCYTETDELQIIKKEDNHE